MNFLVCLLGSLAEGCSKTSANFLCCSYRTLVVISISVKIVTILPGLPYTLAYIDCACFKIKSNGLPLLHFLK